MKLRIAKEDDAGDACAVLRRSIEELCVIDHGNDAHTMQRWLANKTPENVRSWISAPGQRVVVAEENGQIFGVGAATAAGEITLNYVAPEARFRGVSKAILAELERYLREQGRTRSTLSSTQTAYRLYQAAGYRDAGKPQTWCKGSCQPMAKNL